MGDTDLAQQVLRQGVTQLDLLKFEVVSAIDHSIRVSILIHVVSTGAGSGTGLVALRPAVVVQHFLHLVGGSIVRTVDTVEYLVTGSACAEDGEIEALVCSCQRDTIGNLGDRVANIGTVVIIHHTVTIQVLKQGISCLWINLVELIAAEIIDGIALLEVGDGISMETSTAETCKRGIEIGHLIAQRREVSTNAVAEVTDMVTPAEVELETFVLHVSSVDG